MGLNRYVWQPQAQCPLSRAQAWGWACPNLVKHVSPLPRGQACPCESRGRSMRDPILICRPIADARISDNHWLFLTAPDCYRKRSFSKPTKNGLQAECLQPSVRKREILQAHRQPGGRPALHSRDRGAARETGYSVLCLLSQPARPTPIPPARSHPERGRQSSGFVAPS